MQPDVVTIEYATFICPTSKRFLKLITNGDHCIYMTCPKALVMQGGMDVMIDGLLQPKCRRTMTHGINSYRYQGA